MVHPSTYTDTLFTAHIAHSVFTAHISHSVTAHRAPSVYWRKKFPLILQIWTVRAAKVLSCHGCVLWRSYPAMVVCCEGPILPWLCPLKVLSCHGCVLWRSYPAMVVYCKGPILPWLCTVKALSCHWHDSDCTDIFELSLHDDLKLICYIKLRIMKLARKGHSIHHYLIIDFLYLFLVLTKLILGKGLYSLSHIKQAYWVNWSCY